MKLMLTIYWSEHYRDWGYRLTDGAEVVEQGNLNGDRLLKSLLARPDLIGVAIDLDHPTRVLPGAWLEWIDKRRAQP
ncbi:MAG TPA: hypothetical protein DCQ64_15950 [Candidatus Rokubacteria bacterium]|nr:hypothetical protein [Candidatus Rokubacteria bacterium]